VEDRLQNLLDFFASAESDETDLHAARANARKAKNPAAATARRPDRRSGQGIRQGRRGPRPGGVRRELRALPFEHSRSRWRAVQAGTFAAPNDAHPRKVRADFLGNDQATPVTEVGTFRCRALHSNHMAGHLYQEYGSESMRGRPRWPTFPSAKT
jgi:hypothetical protein